VCKKLIKNSQPFGKNFQKTLGGGIFFDSHCMLCCRTLIIVQIAVQQLKAVIFCLWCCVGRVVYGAILCRSRLMIHFLAAFPCHGGSETVYVCRSRCKLNTWVL